MRLELNRSTDLALKAMVELDRRGAVAKGADLARATGTTPAFLAHALAPLVRAGWVGSEPGRQGGYRLLDSAAGASVLDVIDACEGVPDESRCVLRGGPCGADVTCSLHDAWIIARRALLESLDRTPVTMGVPR
jgi:Rrf2 family protein